MPRQAYTLLTSRDEFRHLRIKDSAVPPLFPKLCLLPPGEWYRILVESAHRRSQESSLDYGGQPDKSSLHFDGWIPNRARYCSLGQLSNSWSIHPAWDDGLTQVDCPALQALWHRPVSHYRGLGGGFLFVGVLAVVGFTFYESEVSLRKRSSMGLSGSA